MNKRIILRVSFNIDDFYDGTFIDFSDFKSIREFLVKYGHPDAMGYEISSEIFVVVFIYFKVIEVQDYENPDAKSLIQQLYEN